MFGPVASALLVSIWSGLLGRWWLQRESLLRCFLFLAGLGLTFNLGRDITLLVLWPVVFGYLIVRLIELITYRKPLDMGSFTAVQIFRRIPADHPDRLVLRISTSSFAATTGAKSVRGRC